MLHATGRGWSALLMHIPNRSRQTTLTNLALCFPDMPAAERRALCRESLYHTACTALEMGKAWLWPMQRTISLVREVEGGHLLQQALQSGQGTIILVPHLGNWEIFGLHLAHNPTHNTDTTFMYLPPKHQALNQLLLKTRSRAGLTMAPANRKGVAMIIKALNRNALTGILPDQLPTNQGALHANLFNQPALTMTLISRLLQNKSITVLCGFAERLPAGAGFKVHLQKADPAIHDSNLQHSVEALNRTIENTVKQAPAQYQWEYKRFRRPPDGRKVYH